LRIAALHNIREPGIIPNGYQKEDAPSPDPDHACLPEYRNKTEAMTDTRHAVEYLNPLVHLEINPANRISMINRPAFEMGYQRNPEEMYSRVIKLYGTAADIASPVNFASLPGRLLNIFA
jgi:hypothetical protein